MQRQYQCDNCDAEFKIKHSLDDYYVVAFCPFCGAAIEEDEEEEEEDDE